MALSAQSRPQSRDTEVARKLAQLARLDSQVRAVLMKDVEQVLQLTLRPDLIEKLVARPQALDEVIAELSRMAPCVGSRLSGVRRLMLSGSVRIAA